MAHPAAENAPRAFESVLISRFEWPDHQVRQRLPGMGFEVRITNRPNGAAGITPAPTSEETELARFVVGYCRALFPVDDHGLLLADPDRPGPIREVCVGGGEVMLTDRRMSVVLIKASGALGRAKDERGSIVAIDAPYQALGSAAIVRVKKAFRGARDRSVRWYATRPTGAIDLEPIARIDSDGGRPIPASCALLFDALVAAAGDDALRATLVEADERRRVQWVRDGGRTADGLDIVAEIRRLS
ncbi:hypothetical protein OHQ88_13805 [Micromonospora zamorensis]|uniref:hypothetical protein n=1 Tax=Micromonospora zamorensis TaxID=709883 RepID=UPI002E20103B